MCKITRHAIERAIERMNANSEKDARGRILSAFRRAKYIGNVEMAGRRPTRIFVDPLYKIILVVDANVDRIITVIKPNFSYVAPELFDDVVRMHLQRLEEVERTRAVKLDVIACEHPLIESELSVLDEKILRTQARLNALLARKAALETILNEDLAEIAELNRRQQLLVKSLAKVLPERGNILASVGNVS
ncbi:hypothetical protein [Effusibacillus pohliae]|uniref:hypothetical protein n=1 Tax=Effusibacillus pohliae TaxID=232270 RepID=UPI000360EFB2|nr:hypothetical protein [Effusibacillus pohliae]